MNFTPEQAEDYCFARAFGLMTEKEGEEKFPSLRGHETNRILEMEKQLTNFNNGKEIDSKDHRVVQSIAMLALLKDQDIKFSFPDCVSKTWPQFWDFMEYSKMQL